MKNVATIALAAVFAVTLSTGLARADDLDSITPGEWKWLNHVQTVLGVKIFNLPAAARTAETLCRISNAGAGSDTTLKMMDDYLDSQFTGLTSVQHSAMEASAMRMVCP